MNVVASPGKCAIHPTVRAVLPRPQGVPYDRQLVGWSVSQSVARSVGWSFGRSDGWWVSCSVGQSVG